MKGLWLITLGILFLITGILTAVYFFSTKAEMWFNITIGCVVASGLVFSIHVVKNKNAKLWTVLMDWLTVGFALFAGWKYYETRSETWLWIMVTSLVTLVIWWALFVSIKWSEFTKRQEIANWYDTVLGYRPSRRSEQYGWTEALRTNNWEDLTTLWARERQEFGRNEFRPSGLKLAVKTDNPQAVQFLLDHGANANDPGEDGSVLTPIYLTKSNRPNFEAVMNALIKGGADVNYHLSESGTTPLMYAIQRNDLEKVKYLLDHGADPLETDNHGENVLFWLAQSKPYAHSLAILDMLLPRLQIDSISNKGMTPLLKAAYSHNLNMIQALLEHGADVKFTDQDGETALTYAIKSFLERWNVRKEEEMFLDQMDVLDEVDFQRDLEWRHEQQDTFINNILDTVKILLDNGAELKRPNKEDKFPTLENLRNLFPLKSEDEFQRDMRGTENELVRDVKQQSRTRELETYKKWLELIDQVEQIFRQYLKTLHARSHSTAQMIQEEIVGIPADIIESGKGGKGDDFFRARKGVGANIAEFLVGPYLSAEYEFGRKGGKDKRDKKDKKTFKLPRKWSEEFCKKTKCADMGFSQKASCRPYKNCYRVVK